MTEVEWTSAIKAAMNDVVIPSLKEYFRDTLIPAEREYLFKQFCESRHNQTIDALQRALAAVLAVNGETK